MLLDRLNRPDAVGGAILDGFPRNSAQAEALDAALADDGARVDLAVDVEVPKEELVRRMSGRWVCLESGHVYNELDRTRRRSPGAATSTARISSSARTIAPTRSGAARPSSWPAAAGGRRPLREDRRPAPFDGLQPIDAVAADLAARRPDRDTGGRGLTMVTRKSRAEIASMRRAGRVVAEVLALVERELKPGVTTGHLDRLAEAHIRAAGAIPSFMGYPGVNPRRPFPASLCISLDDEIVHGIPGDRTIREGQIVSIDAGAIVDGWHGDAARTFFVGDAASAESSS